MLSGMTLGLLAGLGAAGLLLGAIALFNAEGIQRETTRRIRRVTRPGQEEVKADGAPLGGSVLSAIAKLGDGLRGTAIMSERDVEELGRLVMASGYSPRHAVPTMIGAKVLLVLFCPMLALGYGTLYGYGTSSLAMLGTLSAAFGLMLPNWVLNYGKQRYAKQLQLGLPDALDLMVICAEAGLGLESALNRVATELRGANAAVTLEFSLLVQQMRMQPDRHTALLRLGERTAMESLQRLGATLAQTLRFGTPLGQALRTLAIEMREERMLRIEERALRLPALLTLPLILFILPCLFIVLAGPSVIQLMSVMGR